MIDISAINNRLVKQDEALRSRMAEISAQPSVDPSMKILIELLGEGLAAIHERQGNLITMMLQISQ